MSMNILALVLDNQGKYKAVEEVHRRGLELKEKVLAPARPRAPGHADEHE